jgi:hypothetical protein
MYSKLFVAKAIVPVGLISGFSIKKSFCSGEDHIPSLDYGWSHHGALGFMIIN